MQSFRFRWKSSLPKVHDIPVKVIGNIAMTQYYILSHPKYNRSEAEIHSDLEESILVVHPIVVALYMALFFGTLLVITTICDRIFYLSEPHASHESEKSRKVKRSPKDNLFVKVNRSEEIEQDDPRVPVKGQNAIELIKEKSRVKKEAKVKLERREVKGRGKSQVAWNMIRFLFYQGSPYEFNLRTQMAFFFIFECAMGMLIVFLLNYMSADLVVYKKPLLLDTLDEVWRERKKFNISFIEASSAPGVFKYSPIGSIQNKLYEKSIAQWAAIEKKTGDNYHVIASNDMLSSTALIKSHRMALLSSILPIGIMLGLECAGAEYKYSKMYRSKESFMSENMVQTTSRFIHPLLEARLRTGFTRVMESGLQDLQLSKGHEMSLANIPLPGPISLLCLNIKDWSEENNEVTTTLKLDNCKQFLKHISCSFIIVSVSLIIEILINTWKKRNDTKLIVPVVARTPKRALDPEECEMFVLLRKRRMMQFEMLQKRISARDN